MTRTDTWMVSPGRRSGRSVRIWAASILSTRLLMILLLFASPAVSGRGHSWQRGSIGEAGAAAKSGRREERKGSAEQELDPTPGDQLPCWSGRPCCRTFPNRGGREGACVGLVLPALDVPSGGHGLETLILELLRDGRRVPAHQVAHRANESAVRPAVLLVDRERRVRDPDPPVNRIGLPRLRVG